MAGGARDPETQPYLLKMFLLYAPYPITFKIMRGKILGPAVHVDQDGSSYLKTISISKIENDLKLK